MKMIVGFSLKLSANVFFSLDKYQLKNMGWNSVFAIKYIENRMLSKCSKTNYHKK